MPIHKDSLLDNFASVLDNKHILITGAAGMLGSSLAKELINLKKSSSSNIVISLLARNKDRLPKNLLKYQDQDFHFIEQDINNLDLPEKSFDLIFNFASPASPLYQRLDHQNLAESNTRGIKNLTGTLNYEAIQEPIFVHMSSGDVYDQQSQKIKLRENLAVSSESANDSNPYSISKLISEEILFKESKRLGYKYLIFRPFNTYGPGLRLGEGRLIGDIFDSIINNQLFLLQSNPENINSFCYIEDFITGLITCINNARFDEIFNLGNDLELHNFFNLKDVIENSLKLDLKCSYKKNHDSPVLFKIPDLTKLRELGWAPNYSLDYGIEKTYHSLINA
jgi:nucleoside-diphosphate-sugar epimerase